MRLRNSLRSADLRGGAVFFAVVLAGLWLGVAQPQYAVRSVPWPGQGEAFTLPGWLPGDCPYYRAIVRSLLRDRDLDLRNDMAWEVLAPEGQVALGRRGEWYPKHPIGLALAALPFYAALGDDGLLLFNLLQVAALDLLVVLLARRYVGLPLSLAVGIAWAFGTLLRPAAYNFAPDVLSTLLVTGGVLALLGRRVALGGALFGASVLVRWTNLPFLPVAAGWLLATAGARPALRFSLGAAPWLLLLGGLDWRMFGNPLLTPYDRVLTFRSGAPQLAPSHRELFDLPFLRTLWLQQVHPESGLLRSAPWVIFAPIGFGLLLVRARAEAVLILALCLTQLAFFAPYREWQSSSYGHRFLLTVAVLAAAPVAALLQAALSRDTGAPAATRPD